MQLPAAIMSRKKADVGRLGMNPQESTQRPKVIILATGGTIAGVGEEGTSVGYDPGTLTVSDLLSSVPSLEARAQIEAEQVCNVNSDDITASIWLDLARAIESFAQREDVCGIVVTHGTDTMEETAFFLNLVLSTSKPVVITGSMRPSTAISADGPMNILESVAVAAHPSSAGRGVLVQFAGDIYCARSVRKTHTHAVCAMDGGEQGACGAVCDGKVHYFWAPEQPHTTAAEFGVDRMSAMPRVNVIFFSVDASPELVTAAASISDGLVIAGAGAGEFSLGFADAINALSIPVVVSTRVGAGPVPEETLICQKSISAGNLSPQKAAILLRLAIAQGADEDGIRRIFATY